MKTVKNDHGETLLKKHAKRIIKFCAYLTAFCALVFAFLSIASYFWLEQQKLEMNDVMSLEKLDLDEQG